MSQTVSPYDVYLGDLSFMTGYRVRSFVRDTAPLVAPRFSTGQHGQSDLDLLKSTAVTNFSGGMFQVDWDDDTRVARLNGVYNPYNSMLYPVPAPTAYASVLNTGKPLAKVETELYSYIAFGSFVTGSGYVSKLYKLDKNSGVLTQITLPSIFNGGAGANANISDLGIHKQYLYISSQQLGGYIQNYRMNIVDNTFQAIGGYGVLMRALRGTLYHINIESIIYAMTNETIAGSATYTQVDTCGQSNPNVSAPTDALEFNGALWIAKPEGLFRFDGVKAVKVLKLKISKLTEYNGALYFVANQWLYKFDGTNVTRLQFFGYGEVPASFSSNQDYLFFETFTTYGTFQSDVFKANSSNSLRRLYAYDGQGFTILREWDVTGLYKPLEVAILYTDNTLLDIYCTAQTPAELAYYDIRYNKFILSDIFKATAITPTAVLDFTTSEFDAGYPNVFKSANAFEVMLTGITAGDTLAVTYQIFDGREWGSWLTLGSITSTTDNKIEITIPENMLFKRIKFNVTATLATASTLAIKGCSIRWTLQPRTRWRWQVALVAYGTEIIDVLGNSTTQSANVLNNLITRSIKSKTPLNMLAPDYGVVKTSVNASATTLVLKGDVPIYADPYDEYPMIAVRNASAVWEFLRVTNVVYSAVSNDTTVTIAERGYLGVTPGTIPVVAEVHVAYRVYVTRLMRDALTLDETTYNEQSTKNSQIKREFTLELTEV